MLNEFYSAVGGRPTRLCADTRNLALRALDAEFGKENEDRPGVAMDDIPGFAELPDLEKYTLGIRRVAETVPIRLISRRLAGSATFDLARRHAVPVTCAGEPICTSVSHVTPDFSSVLETGLRGLEEELQRRCLTAAGDELVYLRALAHSLDSARIFHARTLTHIAALRDEAADGARTEYERLYRTLKAVPENPPRSFAEAVQSLWFQFVFLRLCGNWPAIGRIDLMLGGYLEADLRAGVLALDEARELLAHFFIMGCEWITGHFEWQSGDAQHYQNIVLSGTDTEGRLVLNDVTLLTLEVLEELSISDFPVAVRISEETPDMLYEKIAAVMRHGCGVVAVYHDEICTKAMLRAGYSLSEARSFANDGCWEIQVPGKTCFSYTSMDMLQLFNRDVLQALAEPNKPLPQYEQLEELLDAFDDAVRAWLDDFECGLDPIRRIPSLVMDLFIKDCITNAKGYWFHGPRYTVSSVHGGGLPDVVNSLAAIRDMVFDKKMISLQELVQALRADWEGYDELRQYARRKVPCFGNDDDRADELYTELYNRFCGLVESRPVIKGVRITPGLSTFGREIEWRSSRGASAFGARRGEILSGNLAPTPGTDRAGVTAVIRSACKADFTRMSGSTAIHVRLMPSSVRGEEGLCALMALLKGFLRENGFFLQVDIIDGEELRKARENPEAYRNLAVRVSGWSARFVTLNQEWQDMVMAKFES